MAVLLAQSAGGRQGHAHRRAEPRPGRSRAGRVQWIRDAAALVGGRAAAAPTWPKPAASLRKSSPRRWNWGEGRLRSGWRGNEVAGPELFVHSSRPLFSRKPNSSRARMRFHAPDDRTVLLDPTPIQVEEILRNRPHSYWQQGGNGEALIDGEPGETSLWIKQPESGRFFVAILRAKEDWLVPYDGGSSDSLVEDECGGDPFWIPRSVSSDVDQAVEIVASFLLTGQPSNRVNWSNWSDCLPESYPEP